jgi:SAM-dependent methyltransferase
VAEFGRRTARHARFRCAICGGREGYLPIQQQHLDVLTEYGHPYSPDDYETMSWQSYTCKTCEASDRDRLYALYVKRFLSERPGRRVRLLDIAPGAALGPFLRSQPHVTYRSADLYADGVDDVVDVHDMAIYADESYDLFVCSHVLEHVTDDIKVMREFRRILAGDGRGILMAPVLDIPGTQDEDPTVTDEAERWRRFGQFDHVRIYEKSVYLERLASAGFAVTQHTWRSLGRRAFSENGIHRRSVLYVVARA